MLFQSIPVIPHLATTLSAHLSHAIFGSLMEPGSGAELAIVPHFLHFLLSSLSLKSLTAALICVPRSVQWKEASSTISWQFWQYHRRRSCESPGRGCSITMPTVLAKRTGLCGVLGGRRNISPSPMMMSRKFPSSTTFSIMAPERRTGKPISLSGPEITCPCTGRTTLRSR